MNPPKRKPTTPARTRADSRNRRSSTLTGRGPTRTRPVSASSPAAEPAAISFTMRELLGCCRPEEVIPVLRVLKELHIRRQNFDTAARLRELENDLGALIRIATTPRT